MTKDKLIEVVDESFDAFINHPASVLVCGNTSRCAPCKLYKPVVKELASETDDKVKIGYVDLRQARVSQNIKETHEISSIPVTFFYKSGELVHTQTGRMDKDQLSDMINQL